MPIVPPFQRGTLDAEFCHVWRFDGDRIASFHQFTDSAQWVRLIP